MKNKNIGGCVLSTQPDQQKRPQSCKKKKMRKKCKKLSNIEKIFLARFAHSAFYKIIFLEQLTAMPQFNMQNMFCFFFLFFLTVIMIRTLYFICIIFVKNIIIYWLILTVNRQGSYFPFFCLHPVGQTFLYPSKLCNHLKDSAK